MAETNSLLNCHTPLKRIEGSNPSVSAIYKYRNPCIQVNGYTRIPVIKIKEGFEEKKTTRGRCVSIECEAEMQDAFLSERCRLWQVPEAGSVGGREDQIPLSPPNFALAKFHLFSIFYFLVLLSVMRCFMRKIRESIVEIRKSINTRIPVYK